MATIETEIWVKHPEKEGFVKYVGQRLILEVFEELKKEVEEKFINDENVGFDYLALDYELKKEKNAIFPEGRICVFVLPGANEAYRVNLCVFDSNGGYKEIASSKVWSLKGSHEVVQYIYYLFYGERGDY